MRYLQLRSSRSYQKKKKSFCVFDNIVKSYELTCIDAFVKFNVLFECNLIPMFIHSPHSNLDRWRGHPIFRIEHHFVCSKETYRWHFARISGLTLLAWWITPKTLFTRKMLYFPRLKKSFFFLRCIIKAIVLLNDSVLYSRLHSV